MEFNVPIPFTRSQAPVGFSEDPEVYVLDDTNELRRMAEPARRAQTGTTYTAKGLETSNDVAPPQLDSEPGSSQPVRIVEIVPELLSTYMRTLTYTRMMTDAGVSVSMRAMKTPVLGADYYIDAYSDSPMDTEIAAFVWDNLAAGMSQPLVNTLEDILKFFEDGYSIVEKVYENREWTPPGQGRNTKIYTMLKKLGVRPVSTISKITYDDNGGPLTIQQQAIRSDKSTDEVDLPVNKLCIFSFSRNSGDLTGRSLLRSAYPHWYYKTHFYKIDAVAKERHGIGIPRGKLLPGYNPKDKATLRTMLRNLRTNEESFIIQTPNVEIDFVELKTQLTSVLDSAEHHNMMLLLNVMAAFLSLGTHGSGGSRAVGGVQSDMFMKSLKYIAGYVCEVVNMYIIPELVVWNYPTRNFPQLKVRNIGETRDLQMLGSAIANLVAQNGITMDRPTEQWIRKIFDMPDKQEGIQEYGPPTRETIQEQIQDTNGTTGLESVPRKGNVRVGGHGNTGKPPNAPE